MIQCQAPFPAEALQARRADGAAPALLHGPLDLLEAVVQVFEHRKDKRAHHTRMRTRMGQHLHHRSIVRKEF
jgi:hypothetical protein